MPCFSTRLYDNALAPRIVPRREFRTFEDKDAPSPRHLPLNPDTGNFQTRRPATFRLKNYVFIYFFPQIIGPHFFCFFAKTALSSGRLSAIVFVIRKTFQNPSPPLWAAFPGFLAKIIKTSQIPFQTVFIRVWTAIGGSVLLEALLRLAAAWLTICVAYLNMHSV
jgi:hypothetical protein